VPSLVFTRYTAFGDSFTEGAVALVPQILTLLGPPHSYPARLHSMLVQRYTGQQPIVENAGRGGERASEGLNRLRTVLRETNPEVLLLMDGANDLNGGVAPARVVQSVDDLIQVALSGRVTVMLATLPPQRPGGFRAFAPEQIVPYNDGLRRLARDRGAILVDLYQLFTADMSLIGSDGLHPTQAGYERIAVAFYDGIRGNFERSTTTE
jgi:acyl-CoA thioesterase I